MGAEGHIPHTLFVQVSIDLHKRQATPGEVAHTRHKPTILLARLAWQRLELGLGVVHGLKLVVLHAAPPRVEPPAPRPRRARVFLPPLRVFLPPLTTKGPTTRHYQSYVTRNPS